MRREGLEPPGAAEGQQLYRLPPLCHLRAAAGKARLAAFFTGKTCLPRVCKFNQRGRIRTFDPVLPKHVRYQTTLHAEFHITLPVGLEPDTSGLKDRDPAA